MPKYDFSLPDNQSRLDKMQQELEALEGERQKMRHWKEKKWYTDRFQDQDTKEKFGSKAVEVVLNPSILAWDKDEKYAFTHNAKKAFQFRRDILQDRFRPRTFQLLGGLLLMLVSVVVYAPVGMPLMVLFLIGGGIMANRLWTEYQSTKAFLDVVDQMAFELSQDRLFRKGNASTHAFMSFKNIHFLEEISLGVLVGTFHDSVNVKEDIRRALDDPQWFLIPKTLHGYEMIHQYLKENTTLQK
ncbi:MAG TPA: hypothetical protein DCE41_12110 [Cytophagales bacterium]|nr:hypothetical protein [Cytophagales bacterium]HAA21722.1 hypothetical protein [Cytophagales bacterium]HAP61149.1 hypothetical protein [Cytophagales bacterium]